MKELDNFNATKSKLAHFEDIMRRFGGIDEPRYMRLKEAKRDHEETYNALIEKLGLVEELLQHFKVGRGRYKLILHGFSKVGKYSVEDLIDGHTKNYFQTHVTTNCVIGTSNNFLSLWLPKVAPKLFVCGLRTSVIGPNVERRAEVHNAFFGISAPLHSYLRFTTEYTEEKARALRNVGIPLIIHNDCMRFSVKVNCVIENKHMALIASILT